jgi:chromate reductase
MKTIVTISGSLRKGSYNTALINEFEKQISKSAKIIRLDISDFPMYNEDIETKMPKNIVEAKKAIESGSAVVIATPEYNRSIPGVLKNAIDWISRPYGKNSFAKKPVYIMGASVGSISTALAHYHLTQILLHLDAIIHGQPEIFVGNAGEKIDAKGNIKDKHTKEIISKLVELVLA